MPADAETADWRAALAALTARATDGSGDAARPFRALALQFELRHRVTRRSGDWQGPRDEPAKRAASVDRLGVRPVAAGTRGGWVKDGLTWQNIAYQGESKGFDPAHARWFAQFALLKGTTPAVFTGYGSEWITLDEYESPVLWAMLAEAARLGIALAGSDATPSVVVRERAEIVLDATDDLDGFRLTPRVVLDGVAHAPARARVIGDHGVYRFDFDAGVIEVAPVAGGVRPAQRAMLERADGTAVIRVPSPELPGFLRSVYPRLARDVPVVSLDGSFEPPPDAPPELVLAVRFEPGEVARLHWRWEFADGSVEAFEDGAAEEVASPDLDTHPAPPGATRSTTVEMARDELDGLPMAAIVIRGADAVWFADRALPRLARVEGVRVEVVGEPPTGKEAAGDATIRVSTVESRKRDWFDLGVMIEVDGRMIPFMPLFRALAGGGKRMRLVDGSYLDLRKAVFEPLRELIDEAGTLTEWETGLRIHRSQVSLWADFEDLADVSEPAVAWRALVDGLADGSAGVEPIAAPAGLALPLRPYQLEGFRWLAFLWQHGLGGVLADDMGLGKTAQALALVAHATGSRPFLVVAPTSVASNWVAEAARFTPGLRVASVTATERTRRSPIADAARDADLVITTYAVLRLESEAFAAIEWAGLILDEAQFVKNSATKVHDAARAIRAPFRLAMTGTPIENDLSELWAILRIVAPGLFPSRRAFDERYRRPIEEDRNDERRARLRRRIRPLFLRRTKEQVAPELPAKQEQVLMVELAPRHRRLYDATLQRERQKLLGLIDDLDTQRFIVYRSLTLLRMLALDASLIDDAHDDIPSAKLDALFEQLDDVLAEGHSALVFSQFTSFLGRVAARLDAAGVPYASLDGSTPVRRRDSEIARFRAGEASVFLISLKAGGFGLNLTEADYVFLLDPWWNPASEAQAVDRAHRIGQRRRVNVYRLVAAGTIEEKVMALKARKGELVASILDDEPDGADGSGSEPSAGFADPRLTPDDLRALLDG